MKDKRQKPAARGFKRVVSGMEEPQAWVGAHGEASQERSGTENTLEYKEQEEFLKSEIPCPADAQPDQATRALWTEADEIWDREQDRRPFRAFVAADHQEVYQALVRLQGRLSTVLEWGSGLGVITIMASNLGFNAYGIECEPRLVETARKLAEKYGASAQFAMGSFIPAEYEWNPQCGDDSFRTELDLEPAYEDLDMELRDFDLVYAFPWPDEQTLYHDIMRQCGAENALFLTYDAREGIRLGRFRRAARRDLG